MIDIRETPLTMNGNTDTGILISQNNVCIWLMNKTTVEFMIKGLKELLKRKSAKR